MYFMRNVEINQKEKDSTHDSRFLVGSPYGVIAFGRCSGRNLRLNQFAKLWLREAEFVRRRTESVVMQSDAHHAVELLDEEVDVRTHVDLALVRTADLNDAFALRSCEEQDDGTLILARLRAVLADVHDLFGLATCAGGRIIQVGLVFLLVDLQGFRHDLPPVLNVRLPRIPRGTGYQITIPVASKHSILHNKSQ